MHVPREDIVHFFSDLHRLLKPNGVVGINLPIGSPSEVIDLAPDRRFIENYQSVHEVADRLGRGGFVVIDEDRGHTTFRHRGLDFVVTWLTLFARARSTAELDLTDDGPKS